MQLAMRRGLEALGLMMIGDGVLAAVAPRGHVRLWREGPRPWRAMMDAFGARPRLTAAIGLAEAALGVWLALSQQPRGNPD